MSGRSASRSSCVARGGKEVLHGVDLEIAPRQDHGAARRQRRRQEQPGACHRGRPAGRPRARYMLDGSPSSGLRPEAVRALGVAAVPEGHHVLGDLTVEDNLKVAGSHLKRAKSRPAIADALETFPELRERLLGARGRLSGGQQQMLALAQAIVGRPRYLLADELSFGLAPVIVARLVPVMQPGSRRKASACC